MTKSVKTIITALVAAICLFAAASACDISQTAHARSFPPTLVSVQYGRLLKEGVQKAELYATYENKGLYATNVTVLVKNPENGETLLKVVPEQNSGYSPAITLADFTGDGIKEIYLAMDSGGSGAFGFYYIFDVSDSTVNTIFDYNALHNGYTARYADCYKVVVSDDAAQRNFNIDISSRGQEYLDKLYYSNGKLKKPISADVSAVNTVLPYFASYDRRFNIIVMRRITGLYNADSFGYTQDFMSYQNGGFRTYYQSVAIN